LLISSSPIASPDEDEGEKGDALTGERPSSEFLLFRVIGVWVGVGFGDFPVILECDLGEWSIDE
jgi:hypothetical protein